MYARFMLDIYLGLHECEYFGGSQQSPSLNMEKKNYQEQTSKQTGTRTQRELGICAIDKK